MSISEDIANTCLLCNKIFKSRHSKLYHARKTHNLSVEKYVVGVYYDGKHPICKCGCGELLKFRRNKLGPFFLKYINGHNTRVQKDCLKKKRENTKLNKYGNKYYNNPKYNGANHKYYPFKCLHCGDKFWDHLGKINDLEKRLPRIVIEYGIVDFCNIK